MKPKTKLEKEVFELAKTLRPVTDKQKAWGYEHCLDKKAVITKEKAYCLDCGATWKHKGSLDRETLLSTLFPVECPACGKKLDVIKSKMRTFTDGAQYGILTTYKGYQIFRILVLRKSGKTGEPAKCTSSEIMQHWIHKSGRVFLFHAATYPMYYSHQDYYIPGSTLELRANSWSSKQKLSIRPYKIHPDRRFIPELKRNGFNGKIKDNSPTGLFHKLLADPEAETLLKAGQVSLFEYTLNYGTWQKNFLQQKGIWNSVKICIRNKYIVQDGHNWVDYVQLLKEFNKDINNRHFVCPSDLNTSHDQMVKKKREKLRRMRLEEQRKQVAESQKAYEESKSKFFGLAFSEGDLTVKVLESVEEFLREGDELKHCVFASNYYKKPESLILSARIGDTPIETVEVSLKNLAIVQSRGLRNQPSEYHDQVVSLVNQNLPQISKLLNHGKQPKLAAGSPA